MKARHFLVLLQVILIHCAGAEDAAPNPYQIFAKEQPDVYRIPTNQSSRVQGDPIPDLSKRPSALRPGTIPADVRYSFAEDSLTIDAALRLTNHFCSPSPDAKLLFASTLVVHPGAWMDLKNTDSVGKKSATPWEFLVWDGKTNQRLSGIVLRDRDELKQMEAGIRRDVQEGGGATVRALSTAEMRKWWIFIGFDIQEPTLVLETNDKKRQFIFGFVNRQAVVIDELKKLPNFPAAPPP
jgi:hypothetical protein